ncbi:hypothetical protein BaRGS_00032143 [Batillaria attramentaria]|uniref:DNA 3'-5' helicase n=1 Tax=Batillaria attramentaria TaxID=370345 RepID=A0ABD0JQ27_9CAEN
MDLGGNKTINFAADHDEVSSQPWLSLTPVTKVKLSRANCARNKIFGECDSSMDMSQPWPSCDVAAPYHVTAAGDCDLPITKTSTALGESSKGTSNFRLPTYSPVLSPPDSPVHRLPDLPTFSPLVGADDGAANRKPSKRPSIVGGRLIAGAPAAQTSVSLGGPAKVLHQTTTGKSHTPQRCATAAVKNSRKSSDQLVKSGSISDGSRSDGGITSVQNSGRTPLRGRDCNPFTPAVLNLPGGLSGADGRGTKLRSVEEIHILCANEFMQSTPYRDIFQFPFFNAVQSMAFDQLLYTDQSVVVSAPTGSGKTVLFELALVRLLLCTQVAPSNIRVVYMAPMKSLCSERVGDWKQKLSPLGLECLELTGDSDLTDFTALHHAHIICTTPEKWDSVTRRWKDNRSLFQEISLMCIDEVHVVGDAERGATVEAVITRMKMVQTQAAGENAHPVRFVAVSATLPNTEDIAEWLSSPSNRAAVFKLGEEYRPVKLHRVVLGYPFPDGSSEFRFDISLTYKLRSIIDTYSQSKPTLVFCSSRKSVQQTAETLVKQRWGQPVSLRQSKHRQDVHAAASSMQDKKISSLVMCGVGVHHAGMGPHDRRIVEDLFKSSKLPVLVATSTLSVGVNLPAHLVVVKATHIYVMGVAREYSDLQVLQMTGRAGRPQFDTSATVVIMTKAQSKSKYEALVNGTQVIESTLHRNLTEHVNVEIVLHTITDIADAVFWLTHTFLHVRVAKNPRHYGLPAGVNATQVEKRLQERGSLMARYCLEFQTLKVLVEIPAQCSLEDMVKVVASCPEFSDIQLRTSEKKTLNALNKNKIQETIKFPMQGKIKTKQMKVNCLIQAGLGCLPVQDFSLSQDLMKIFRVGQRVTKCLMELQWLGSDFASLLHASQLCKAFKARLWPDSKHVARQLEGIGPTISQAFVNAGLTSFEKLEASDPRHLELVVNRHPPFGSKVHEAVAHLPRYQLMVQQVKQHQANTAYIVVCISLFNAEDIKTQSTCGRKHQSVILIGDDDNNVVFKWRLMDGMLMSQPWRRSIHVKRAQNGGALSVVFLSLDWVGLDIHTMYHPIYTGSHPQTTPAHMQKAGPSQSSETKQGTKRRVEQTTIPKTTQMKANSKTTRAAKPKGSRSASGIQQQLDIMMNKIQQFQYATPQNVDILRHNRPGNVDCRDDVRLVQMDDLLDDWEEADQDGGDASVRSEPPAKMLCVQVNQVTIGIYHWYKSWTLRGS